MVPKQSERLVIGVRGEGGARRPGFLAPDLLAVGGVDLLGFVAQDRNLLLGEAAGQEQIAFFSELPKLLRRQRHRGLLPSIKMIGGAGARFRRRRSRYGLGPRARRPRHRRRERGGGSPG